MLPPAGMETCDPLETWVGVPDGDDQAVTISCWQMSAEELAEVNRNGGRIWVRVLAVPPPPIGVEVESPFV